MPAPIPSFVLRGLAQQGFYELSEAERQRLDRALKLTPILTALATAAGLALQEPALHLVLAGISATGFLLPAHHPFDLLYNHLLRRLGRRPALPPSPLPRRLAMLVPATLNLAICGALLRGRVELAYLLGGVVILVQALLVARQLCLVSWLLERLAVARNRPERQVTGDEARRLIDEGALLVDVRSPKEFAQGHLPGAVNVPIDGFEERVDELLAERRPLVLYCAAGVRCNKAARMLEAAGSRQVHQLGTMRRWSEPSAG